MGSNSGEAVPPATPWSGADADDSDGSLFSDPGSAAQVQVMPPDPAVRDSGNATASSPAPLQGAQPASGQGSLSSPHDVVVPSSSGKAEVSSSRPLENPPAAPAVQSARVLERMGQSEMHVGVRTAGFGNVEVHTSLNQNHVDALITSAHPELRAAMQAEIGWLQHAMDRHQLHLGQLDVGARNEGHGGAPSEQQPRPAPPARPAPADSAPSETANSPPAPPATWYSPNSAGISVIA